MKPIFFFKSRPVTLSTKKFCKMKSGEAFFRHVCFPSPLQHSFPAVFFIKKYLHRLHKSQTQFIVTFPTSNCRFDTFKNVCRYKISANSVFSKLCTRHPVKNFINRRTSRRSSDRFSKACLHSGRVTKSQSQENLMKKKVVGSQLL